MRWVFACAAVIVLFVGFSPTLRAELVSKWSFDGDLLDSGPGGNDGSYGPATGSPTFVEGRDGTPEGAISLNGTTEFVRIAQNTKLPAIQQPVFTLAFWVKAPAPVTGIVERRLFSEASTTSNTPLHNLCTVNAVGNTSLDFFLRGDTATPANHLKSARPAFDGTWHHVAWVDNNGTVSCYIDGIKDATNFSYNRAATAYTVNTTTIGAIERGTPPPLSGITHWFLGVIDDFRFYDHPLTVEEIQEVTAGPDCPDEGDTTCTGLTVDGPDPGNAGWYTFTASGVDASGDAPLLYLFRMRDSEDKIVLERGPQLDDTLVLPLGPGVWTVSVTVDDDPLCPDTLPAATCTQVLTIDPPPQLISRWTMDGHVLDSEASGNHGTIVADAVAAPDGIAPIYVEGFDGTPGGAIQLSGDDYIDVLPRNNLPLYPLFQAYTVALWVKGNPQVDKRMYSEGSSTSNDPLLNVGTDNTAAPNTTGKADIFIRNNPGAGTPVSHRKSDRIALDDTWHHIAWVDDGGKGTMYIDGVRDAAQFNYTRGQLTVNRVSIGGILRATAAAFFTGAIDDVRVYNYALSAEEVSAIVPEPSGCPGDADTHCQGVAIDAPDDNLPGTYAATVSAVDDSGDPILYTFVIEDAEGNFLRQIGPGASETATFELLSPGVYTLTVTVDDSIRCKDQAADAVCVETIEVRSEPSLEVARWVFDGDLVDGISGSPAEFLGTGDPVFGEGYDCIVDGAFVGDGVSALLRAEENDLLPLTRRGEFTIAFWAKGMPQNDRRVFSESSSLDNSFLYNLGTDNTGATGSLDFYMRDGSGANPVNHVKSVRPVFDGTWHHVVWMDDEGQVTCYIDGVLDATNFNYTRPLNLTQDITTIGGILRPLQDPTANRYWFAGSVDDVRLFNFILTEAEALALYGDGPSHCCPAEGDTHCEGLTIAGPEGNTAGTYTVTAQATDDSGDPIIYTFTATPAEGDPIVVGPQSGNSAQFALSVGVWTIEVTVDDDPLCDDVAEDATCTETITVVTCPPEGDTHCDGLTVTGPAGNVPGTYTATAQATDDSGDAIIYTFTATPTEGDPTVVGPQSANTAEFDLTEGTWQISVAVDDDPECPDVAEDATCTETVVVSAPGVGPFKRGDSNDDGGLDISDGVYTLNWLFAGGPEPPCIAAANPNGEAAVSITSAIYTLNFLFLGGPEPFSPYPDCGLSTDEVDFALGCETYSNCP